jgi:biotin carboxyl carrier protein
MSSDPDVEQARRAAQRAAARKRQANFRARERARGLEMITLKVPAPMRGAFARLAAVVQSGDDGLDDSFDEIREALAEWRARPVSPEAPVAEAPAPQPRPAEAAAPPAPEPAAVEETGPVPFETWVDLAGLWSSSAIVGSLTDFTVVVADLEGSLYTRWTAQQRRPSGYVTVDAYVRGTRGGPQDAVVSTGRMTLGGRDLELRAVVTSPARMDATLTVRAADGSQTVHEAVFTRAG